MNSFTYPGRGGSPGMARAPVRMTGISLIEALVALAVISIGLAGMSVLQANALQHAHAAHNRSIATTIALDFEERLWLELAASGLSGCPESGSSEGSPAADLITDWTRHAADEGWAWSDARLLSLPNLSISVGTPTSGSSVVEIPVTFSWQDTRFTDVTANAESFDYTIRILCRPVAS